ncbi:MULTISPECIES: winged helix-turn-helix transcriptional regulator [Bradyrhizobium]|uniref:winged helix-turn-helix transcriptional regulator n=1 Tax=Bradyrhizobium elkanii TaxID=29448 RepID=UPI0003FBB331|nr:helix-turn-helix domain-containing protein [Bradyrhizobium elkanii]
MQHEAHHPELIYPPELEIWPFPAHCPNRVLIEEIADKWTILVVAALSRGPTRFNQLKRALEPVTQKSLTQTLRRLERSGMVSRKVLDTSPVAVEYAITPLGRTLGGPFSALYRWAVAYHDQVGAARQRFDAQRGKARK